MRAIEIERDLYLESYLDLWEKDVRLPLLEWARFLDEAALNQSQIDALFGDIEQKMSGEKTTIGKGLAVAGKATSKGARVAAKLLPTNIVNKIDELIKDTKPVKAFDSRFEQAKEALRIKLGGDNSKVVRYIEAYGEMAKKRPILQAAIIAILTIAAGIATGPAGAAAVGALLRTGNELLKGERLSKSLIKGASTGIIATVAGMTAKELAQMIGDPIIDQVYVEQTAKDPGINISSSQTTLTFSTHLPDGTSEIKKIYLEVMGTPDELERINSTLNRVDEALNKGDIDQASRLMKTLADQEAFDPEELVDKVEKLSPDGKHKVIDWIGQFTGKDLAEEARVSSAIMQVATDFERKVRLIQKGLEQAAIAIASGASSIEKNRTNTQESILSEADLKAIANNIAAWAKDKATSVGKEISQEVTLRKLMFAWEKAGKPTDSADIHRIMLSAGIPEKVLRQAFRDSRIPVPGTSRRSNRKTTAQPVTVSTGDVAFDKQINDMIAKQGKDAAIAYLNKLKQQVQASPAQAAQPSQPAKHGDVKKASDGQSYRLDIGKAGDRIWLNVATGSEASPAIDRELEGKPKKKRPPRKKRPTVPKPTMQPTSATGNP